MSLLPPCGPSLSLSLSWCVSAVCAVSTCIWCVIGALCVSVRFQVELADVEFDPVDVEISTSSPNLPDIAPSK